MSIRDFNAKLHSDEPVDAQMEALRRLTRADDDQVLKAVGEISFWQAWYED